MKLTVEQSKKFKELRDKIEAEPTDGNSELISQLSTYTNPCPYCESPSVTFKNVLNSYTIMCSKHKQGCTAARFTRDEPLSLVGLWNHCLPTPMKVQLDRLKQDLSTVGKENRINMVKLVRRIILHHKDYEDLINEISTILPELGPNYVDTISDEH